MCAVLSGDARLSNTADGEGEPAEPAPEFHSMEDFPLEQSRDDTLRSAFDQVIQIDGQLVCPNAVQTYPHFSLIGERLSRVSCDAQKVHESTHLLVLRSRRSR